MALNTIPVLSLNTPLEYITMQTNTKQFKSISTKANRLKVQFKGRKLRRYKDRLALRKIEKHKLSITAYQAEQSVLPSPITSTNIAKNSQVA